ncbi:MAG: PEP-CTERM sorting domain-containing protein [Nitrospirae bacterium]|nr:PEP-CTERM sorting domain-containing protein [Nitrospirota bacterium]
MVKRLLTITVAALALLMAAPGAQALYQADISYTAVDNGGGSYTFNYTVANTSTGLDTAGLDFFKIDFNADAQWARYSGLAWASGNGWVTAEYQFDPGFSGLPASVWADDSVPFGSGGGGIAQGASLGGFSVTFGYGGATPPALLAMSDQLFSWHAEFGTNMSGTGTDMGGYWIQGAADGTTRYVDAGYVIPEPGTVFLFGVGLAGIAARGMIRAAKSRRSGIQ